MGLWESIGGSVGAAAPELLGGWLGADAARKEGNTNRAEQREYATNSIRWRVKDAQAAGIHPLYAMGATGASFQPVSTGAPEILANMGQNVGRAIQSKMSQEDRTHVAEMNMLQREHLKKQNALLDAQTTSIMKSSLPPAMPGGSDNFMPGQGESGSMQVKPSSRTRSAKGAPEQQQGWIPDVGWARTKTGLTPVPSSDIKERIEDQFIPETMWAVRNQIMPNVSKNSPPPKEMLPKGADKWEWSYLKQEWQPKSWKEDFKKWWDYQQRRQYQKVYTFEGK